MYRVIALGFGAGDIVDRLRTMGAFEDIEFIYCDSDEERYNANGTKNDRHILLKGLAQCRKEIHDDKDIMSVLVADLGDECARKYAVEIMHELWNYADYTYFFGINPFCAGHMREKAEPVLHGLLQWSSISVIQDNLKLPKDVFFIDMNNGIARLLRLVLSHPQKWKSEERDDLPFGVWATEKQLLMSLQAMYSNCKDMAPYYNAGTFSFLRSTNE